VLDLLLRLVRKSLVVTEEGRDGAGRQRLLETLRQYARERLVAAGELEAVQDRHALYYLQLAEEAEPQFIDREWTARLSAEHDNLRATMRWFSESNAVAQTVRLGGALWRLWVVGGHLAEGRAQLRILMALPGLSRASSDWARLAFCDGTLAFVAGDYTAARDRLEEVVALRRTLGDQHGLAVALSYLGNVVREQADYLAARGWLEESLTISEQLGDRELSAETLDRLGTVAHALGDYSLAQSQYDQGLALAEQVGNLNDQPWLLHNLSCLALDQGDYPAARAWLAQSLELRREWDKLGLVHALAEFACLAAAEGLPAAALHLAGAAAGLTQQTGIPIQYTERGRYERWLAAARQALGEEVAAEAWAEGYQMRLEQAVAYALAPRESVAAAATTATGPRPAQPSDQLTPREREVAALVARGNSNRQIGEALVITERTVAAHIEHILNKLGFVSRTQIGVWAAEHGLVVSTIA
jgi:non-specific serine/threonine protein kinase